MEYRTVVNLRLSKKSYFAIRDHTEKNLIKILPIFLKVRVADQLH